MCWVIRSGNPNRKEGGRERRWSMVWGRRGGGAHSRGDCHLDWGPSASSPFPPPQDSVPAFSSGTRSVENSGCRPTASPASGPLHAPGSPPNHRLHPPPPHSGLCPPRRYVEARSPNTSRWESVWKQGCSHWHTPENKCRAHRRGPCVTGDIQMVERCDGRLRGWDKVGGRPMVRARGSL